MHTRFWGGKSEVKRPLGIPRCMWEDDIKIDSREVVCGGMDLISFVQERDQWRTLVNMVMNFRVLKFFRKFLSS
jgi:hypothetical protein